MWSDTGAAAKSLSRFSHELRTPLTSIRSFSEILLTYEVKDSEKRRRFLTIIHEEAERLSRAVEELLELSGRPGAPGEET